MPNTSTARARRLACAILAGAASLSISACGTIGPDPWQKDLMAKREMRPDPYPMETAAAEHIYFSKEASSGGRGFAGGGCGCN
jgi:hypothetical protein